jgi:predicted MFS family arabinose efflux permease
LTSAGTVCAGIMFVASGVVIDRFSWHSGFLLKVALAALALIALFVWVPPSRPQPGPRVNLFKGILFAPALAALLVGVQQIGAWGFADIRLWALFASGALLLAVWARTQLHESQPLIGLRILANRQIALANVCFVVVVLGTIQIGQILSMFFQQPLWTGTGLGLTATGSGLMHLVLDAFSIIAAPWSGRIAAKHGARRATLLGFCIIAVAWAWLAVWHGDRGITLAAAAFALSGYAVTATALYNLIIESTPQERTGEATGLTYVFFTAFFAVGAQIIFALLGTSHVAGHVELPSDAAYTLGFGYIAATGVLGFLLASLLPRQRRGGRA